MSSLKINYLFENFFPKNDTDYIAYKAFRQNFTNDDRFVQIAFSLDKGIFNSSSIEKIDSIEQVILAQEKVMEIQSLLKTKIPVKTPLGWISASILKNNPSTLQEDSAKIMANPKLRGNLISEDGSYYAIQLKMIDSTSDNENRILVEFLEQTMEDHGIEKYHLGGFINTQVNYIRLLEGEFPMAAATSAISMCLILLILYRSYKNALLPTMTVVASMLLFFGYLGLIGRDLNITSTLFITIITIVAVSDIVHLQTYYHKYLRKGLERGKAIQQALSDTAISLLMTSVTTAIGFFTFLSSGIPHIRTFGIDAGIGVIIAFLIAITLGSVLLYHFPPTPQRLEKEKSEKHWDKFLHRVYLLGKNHKYTIYFVTFLILVASFFGIKNIQSNQFLSGNFDPSTQIKKDFNFFESQFGGIRALEMHLKPLNGKKITDLEILNDIEKLEVYLESVHEVAAPLSPASWIKSQSQAVAGGRSSSYQLPQDQEAIEYLLINDTRGDRKSVISLDGDAGRLIAKMHDIGSDAADSLHREINTWAIENIDTSLISLNITGSALLIDKNNDNLLKEMVNSLALAFISISLLMALLFRRGKMILISIIPNIIPLIAVAGVMGWLGIPLNAATSLIFTIGFVIAIDDTIHFLARFRREYQGRNSLELSLKNTLNHTGKAILHTTIILIVVYTASMLSNFTEIAQHAILVAATLVFALLSDFFLLPALLRQAAKRKDLF